MTNGSMWCTIQNLEKRRGREMDTLNTLNNKIGTDPKEEKYCIRGMRLPMVACVNTNLEKRQEMTHKIHKIITTDEKRNTVYCMRLPM